MSMPEKVRKTSFEEMGRKKRSGMAAAAATCAGCRCATSSKSHVPCECTRVVFCSTACRQLALANGSHCAQASQASAWQWRNRREMRWQLNRQILMRWQLNRQRYSESTHRWAQGRHGGRNGQSSRRPSLRSAHRANPRLGRCPSTAVVRGAREGERRGGGRERRAGR